jgi:putative two-component system response regulator
MGLDGNTVRAILYAAPMHDLGKIGIPDKILTKPGKLDPVEQDIMKLHTVIGAKILNRSDEEFIKLGGTIALAHHEKWDGSGYPNGLKGTAIPISGRIAAIADVFDALTSKRPYKEPFSLEKSIVIIRRWSESYFDPEVVDAFIAIQDEILTIKEECVENNHQAFNIPELTTLLRRYECDEWHNEPLKIGHSMGTDLSSTLSLPLHAEGDTASKV